MARCEVSRSTGPTKWFSLAAWPPAGGFLKLPGFLVGRNGGFGGLDELLGALNEIAFLLLVLLVGAGVHVVRTGFNGGLIGGSLLVGNLRLLVERAAFGDGIGNLGGEEADGAQRVIVARNDPIHHVGIAVGVHDRDDRDAHAAGFLDGDLLGIRVNDKHGVRQLG